MNIVGFDAEAFIPVVAYVLWGLVFLCGSAVAFLIVLLAAQIRQLLGCESLTPESFEFLGYGRPVSPAPRSVRIQSAEAAEPLAVWRPMEGAARG